MKVISSVRKPDLITASIGPRHAPVTLSEDIPRQGPSRSLLALLHPARLGGPGHRRDAEERPGRFGACGGARGTDAARHAGRRPGRGERAGAYHDRARQRPQPRLHGHGGAEPGLQLELRLLLRSRLPGRALHVGQDRRPPGGDAPARQDHPGVRCFHSLLRRRAAAFTGADPQDIRPPFAGSPQQRSEIRFHPGDQRHAPEP